MNLIEDFISIDDANSKSLYTDINNLAIEPYIFDISSESLIAKMLVFLEEKKMTSVNFIFLCCKLDGLYFYRQLYGSNIADYLLNIFQDAIRQIIRNDFMIDQFFIDISSAGEIFVILNNINLSQNEFDLKIYSLRIKIKSIINKQIIPKIGCEADIKIGFFILNSISNFNFDNQSIFYLVSKAKHNTIENTSVNALLRDNFEKIIKNDLIFSHYQPIINLSNGYILGWEALTRFVVNDYFNSVVMLFDFAENIGSLFLLEKICRDSAIRNFGTFDSDQKLFINIHPKTMLDPNLQPLQTLELLNKYGLKPINIVFEITERHSIKDFSNFYRILERYRKDGYGVAIDDVGTGYSGLTTIADIRPDFIKIDMDIVRHVDVDPIKRALIESLLYFSEKIGCKVIAEGIEKDRELTTLASMGMHYGQGFYISPPEFPKPCLIDDIKNKITVVKKRKYYANSSLAIEALVEFATTVKPTTLIKDIKSYFTGTSPLSSIVVVDDNRPIGLIMNYHLNDKLSTQYGVALYLKKPVTQIMDISPLIVDANTSIGKVAQDAMSREDYKIYDNIIVTKHGNYIGIVSVQNMFDALAKMNIEIAKGANPLTGLPGNIAIEQEIEMRLKERIPFSLVYADLDNFKAYNDLYGFKKGDQIILLLARILRGVLKKYGLSRDFVGHIGGDDFVVIMSSSSVDLYCEKVVQGFGRAVPAYFSPEDRKRGYFLVEDRHGEMKNFQLTSVSLAVVDCSGLCSFADIAKKAVQIKKYAKSIPGNCWVRDRRSSYRDDND